MDSLQDGGEVLATSQKHCGNPLCQRKSRGSDLKSCSRCRKIQYCDRECQQAHWKEHKKSCGSAAKKEVDIPPGTVAASHNAGFAPVPPRLYINGAPAPAGLVQMDWIQSIVGTILNSLPKLGDYAPSTWDEADAWWQRELRKPAKDRDPAGFMVSVTMLGPPDVSGYIKEETMGVLIPVSMGSTSFMQAASVPVTTFKSPQDPQARVQLVDKQFNFVDATMMLWYFKKMSDRPGKVDEKTESMQLPVESYVGPE